MKRSYLTTTAGLLILGVAGCAVEPNYSRPTVPTSSGWKEQAITTNAPVLPTEWWRIFDDTELNPLEAQSVEANQDLKQAVARVTEARAIARVSAAELFPSISARGAYLRNHLSENLVRIPGQDLNADDVSAGFDLDYELDVWGRVRRSVEAARADASAVATDLEVVLLTLTADVARDYYLIRHAGRGEGGDSGNHRSTQGRGAASTNAL